MGIRVSDLPQYDGEDIGSSQLVGTLLESGTNVTYRVSTQALLDAITATVTDITGEFLGASTTYAGLPDTGAENGDYAILTEDDGENLSGLYLWDGDAFVFAYEITAFQELEVESQLAAYGIVENTDSENSVDGRPVDFAVMSADHVAPFAVFSDGGVRASSDEYQPARTFHKRVFEDASGNVSAYQNTKGQWWFNFEPGAIPTTPKTLKHAKYGDIYADFLHLNNYGQSLSRGTESLPRLSTSQPFNNKMFEPYVHYVIGQAKRTTLTDLEEIETLDNLGETPSSGMANFLTRLGMDAGLGQWDYLASCTGLGGRSLQDLQKNGGQTTLYYQQLIEEVKISKRIVEADGKTYKYLATVWTQGETDYVDNTTQADYLQRLIQFQNDLALDIQAITGQDFEPPMFISQCTNFKKYAASYSYNDHAIALAQLQASARHGSIYIACPGYILERAADSTVPGAAPDTDKVHLSSEGSRMLGFYYALAMNKVFHQKQDFRSLQPTKVIFGSDDIKVHFHVPYGALQFNTSIVASATNYGFDIADSDGDLVDIIDGTPTISGNVVTIPISRALTEGEKLTYAFGLRVSNGDTDGSITGPRGNLCDSQGDAHTYVGADSVTRRLDNYCVLFEAEYREYI